jgi:hypothetical protein
LNNLPGVLALLAFEAVASAAPLTVVCSADVPIVEARQEATASVLTDFSPAASLRYEWKASGGSLSRTSESAVQWSPNGAPSGPYTLSVTVTAPDGSSASCSVVVLAGRETRGGGGRGQTRELRSAMLLPGKNEAENFGLYSYMLLGSKPNAGNRERYVTFLKAFTDTVASYDRLSEQLTPPQLNIAYLPVRDDAPANFKVEEWLLDHYDYDRAKRLLESIPGVHTGDGPYIISSDHPLTGAGHPPERYLFEDLTTAPVTVVKFWVDQFRIQTAQERWDHATLSGVALRIRTSLEIAAVAYPEIRSSIASLLKTN